MTMKWKRDDPPILLSISKGALSYLDACGETNVPLLCSTLPCPRLPDSWDIRETAGPTPAHCQGIRRSFENFLPQMRRVVATGRVGTFEAHVCLGKRQKFAGGMILGFHRVARHGLQIPAINIECILSLTPGTGSRMFQACRRMLFLSPEFRNAPYGIIFAQCLDERCGLGGFWKVRLVHLPYRVSPAHSTLPDTGSSLRKSSCEAPRIVKEHGRGRCSLSL